MTRVRKLFAVLTLALALTAGSAVPASAEPGDEAKAVICDVTTELKYQWGIVAICIP